MIGMDSYFKRCLLMAGVLSLTMAVNGSAQQTKSSTASQKKRNALRRSLAKLKAMPPVRGVVFHCCSCAVPCPCMFNGQDVEGCNIVRIYHITDGGFEGKDLTGLTVVYVPHPEDLQKKAGGLRKEGKPVDAVLYVSAGLTAHQEQSLMGQLAENNMTIVMNTVLKRHVPISFVKQSNGYEVTIPHVFHARMQNVQGVEKKPIILENLSLSEGSRWYLGRSAVHDYQDSEEKEWNWTYPKSNGSWTFFAWGPHIDPSDEYEANKRDSE